MPFRGLGLAVLAAALVVRTGAVAAAMVKLPALLSPTSLLDLCDQPAGSLDCTIRNKSAVIQLNTPGGASPAVLAVNGTVKIEDSVLVHMACTVFDTDCGMSIAAANIELSGTSQLVGNKISLVASGSTLSLLQESIVDVSCSSRFADSLESRPEAGVGFGGIGGGHGGAGSGTGEDRPCSQAAQLRGHYSSTIGGSSAPRSPLSGSTHWGGEAFGFASIRSPNDFGGGSCSVRQRSGRDDDDLFEEGEENPATWSFAGSGPPGREAALRELGRGSVVGAAASACPVRGGLSATMERRVRSARALRWAGRLAAATGLPYEAPTARGRDADALGEGEDDGTGRPSAEAMERVLARAREAAAGPGPWAHEADAEAASEFKSCWTVYNAAGGQWLRGPKGYFVPGGGVAVLHADLGTLVIEGTSVLADGESGPSMRAVSVGGGSGGAVDAQAGSASIKIPGTGSPVAFSATGGNSAKAGGGGGGMISLGTPSFQGVHPSWFDVNGGETPNDECELGGGGVVYLFPNSSTTSTYPPKLWCRADAAMRRRAVTVVPVGSNDLFNSSVSSAELMLQDCNWQMFAYSTLFASTVQMEGSSLEVSRFAMVVSGGIDLSLNSQLSAGEVGGKLTIDVTGGLFVSSSLVKSDTLHILADNITIDQQSYVHFASTADVIVGGLTVLNDLTQSDIPTTPTQLTLTATDITVGKSGDIAASQVRVLVKEQLTITGQISADTVTVSPQCAMHGPGKGLPVPADVNIHSMCNLSTVNGSAGFAAWISAKSVTIVNGGGIVGSTIRLCARTLSVDAQSGIEADGMGCPASGGIGAGGYSTGVPGGGAGHGGGGGEGALPPLTPTRAPVAGAHLLPTPRAAPGRDTGAPAGDTAPALNSGPQSRPAPEPSSLPAAMAMPTPNLTTPTPSPTPRPSASSAPRTSAGGASYDKAWSPSYVGSGGGGTGAYGGAGGGVVLVTVSAALINGQVRANGATGSPATSSSAAGGGGSGGTIMLELGSLDGTGRLSANGGDGGEPGGGGGGGGIVRVVHLLGPLLGLGDDGSVVPARPWFNGSLAVTGNGGGRVVPGTFSGVVTSSGGISGSPASKAGNSGQQDSAPACTLLGYGTALCEPCPPGTYKNTSGSSECRPCLPGTFASDQASSTCQLCGAGNYTGAWSSRSCSRCPAGYLPNLAHTECSVCDAGWERIGAAFCQRCPPGQSKKSPGDSSCNPCEPGYAAPRAGSTSCGLCEPGTVAPGGGASECGVCEAGTFSSVNRSECRTCPPGSHSPPRSFACKGCPSNSFSEAGAARCEVCDLGRYSAGNASYCLACPAIPYHAEFLRRETNMTDLGAAAAAGLQSPARSSLVRGLVAARPSDAPRPARCDFECDTTFVDYPECVLPWQVVTGALGGVFTAAAGGAFLVCLVLIPSVARWCFTCCAVRQGRSKAGVASDFRHAAAALGTGKRGGNGKRGHGKGGRGSVSHGYGIGGDDAADLALLGAFGSASGTRLGRDRRGSTGSQGSLNGLEDSSNHLGYARPLLTATGARGRGGTAAAAAAEFGDDLGWGFPSDAGDEREGGRRAAGFGPDGDDGSSTIDGDDLASPLPRGDSRMLVGTALASPRGAVLQSPGVVGRRRAGDSPGQGHADAHAHAASSAALAASMHRGAAFAQAARKDLPWARIRTRTEDLPLFLHRLYFEGNNSLVHPWRSADGVPAELYASVLHAELSGLQRALTAGGLWSASQRRSASALWWLSHPLYLAWKARARDSKAAEVAQQLEPFVERLFRNPRARMLGNCLRFGSSPCRTLGWVDVLVQDREDAGGAPVGVPRDTLVLPVSGTGQFEAPFRLDLEDVLTRAAVATMLAPWLPPSARFVTDINDALRTVQGGRLRGSFQAAAEARRPLAGRRHRRQASRNRSLDDDDAAPVTDTAALDRALAGPGTVPGVSGGFDDTVGRSFYGTPARGGVGGFDDGGSEADVDGDADRADRLTSPPVSRRLASASSARSPGGDLTALADAAHAGAAAESDDALVWAGTVGTSLSSSTLLLLRDVQRVVDLTNRAMRDADAPFRVCLGVTSALPAPSPTVSRLAVVFLSTDEEAAARRQGAAAYLPYETVLLVDRQRAQESGASGAAAARIPARKPTVHTAVAASSTRRMMTGASTARGGDAGSAAGGGSVASNHGGGSGSRSMSSRAAGAAGLGGSYQGGHTDHDSGGGLRGRGDGDAIEAYRPSPHDDELDDALDGGDTKGCCRGGGCAAFADTACRCACPCLMSLFGPRPSTHFVLRRCCDPLANARIPLVPGAVALQILFFLLVEVAACAVACTTLLYFWPWALIATLAFPPGVAVFSPVVGFVAMAVHSAKATRLHASMNFISFLPAVLGAGVLFVMMAVSDTQARGTEAKPFPLVLDVWLGILTPSAWLFSKFMLVHILPSRAAAQESARDNDVELYVLRKHLASAVMGLL